MLNAVQFDTVCAFTTITCECPLNFPVHSITSSLMDNSDYTTCLHRPVHFSFFISDKCVRDQHSQACLGAVVTRLYARLFLYCCLHSYFHRKINRRHSLSLWRTNYIFFPSIQCAHFSVDQWKMNNNMKNWLLIWQIPKIWKLTFNCSFYFKLRSGSMLQLYLLLGLYV